MKVTIYVTSEFMGSVIKREGTLIDCGLQKYAQFDRAPFVKYIPKGKRNATGFVKTSFPYLLIIEGWNQPEPADFLTPGITDANGTTIKISRYMSFDERYKTDFDFMILPHLAKSNVILDVRHTVGTELIKELQPV